MPPAGAPAAAGRGDKGLSPRQQVRRALLHTIARTIRQRRPIPPAMVPQRLLLIRPDHLGDVLWLTPAIRVLRQRFPDAAITVAAGPWSRPILANNPDIGDLIAIDFPGFERRPKRNPLAPYRLLAAESRRMQLWGFDTAVVLRDDHWWGALLATRAGIPRRLGYRHPDVARFLTDSLSLPAPEHTAIGNLRLAGRLLQLAGQPALLDPTTAPLPADFPLVFHPGDEAETKASALLAALPGDRGPLVAIHPSAGVPVKLWDEARLAAVADHLAAEFGARIILTGGPGDEALTGAVAAQMTTARPLDLTGRTDIASLVALYRCCALVLGPDGGALHLAVAAGAPTVHLFGPADPVKFGPWGDPARQRVVHAGLHCARCGDLAPSRPRGAACMLAIGVDEVLAAARPLLAAVRR